MIPDFPDYARILLDGFSEKPSFGVLRTEMDAGVAKQRARWSLPVTTRQAVLMVESLEAKRQMDRWFRYELAGGAGWFSWRDPVAGKTVRARFVGGELQWTPDSPQLWRAGVQIETTG